MSRVRRVTLLLLLMLGVGLFVGPSAVAQVPGFSDCKEAPEPEYPGSGMVGSLDPPRERPGDHTSIYARQGYAGLVWHTYDLGCYPNASKMTAPIDTWVGNQLFNVAKVVVGVTNALNWTVADGGLLDRLDSLLVDGSLAIYHGVFVPWISLVLVVLTVVVLWKILGGRGVHRGGDVAGAARRVFFALAGVTLASSAYLTPVLWSNIFDEILVVGVTDIRERTLSAVSVDPTYALPDTLHHEVVYRTWLAGAFGMADNAQAEELGRDLAWAQAFTVEEVESGQTGDEMVERKKERFHEIAEQTGPAYPFFQGIAGSRTGAGAFAILEAVVFASFQIITLLALFLCQFLLRVIIILAPALGLLAVIRNQTFIELMRGIGTTLWHGLVLTVAASVHLLILVTLSGNSLTAFEQIALMTVTTVILVLITRPFHRFKSMFYGVGGVFGLNERSMFYGSRLDERTLKDVMRRQHRKTRRSGWIRDQVGWWGEKTGGTGRRESEGDDSHDGPELDPTPSHWDAERVDARPRSTPRPEAGITAHGTPDGNSWIPAGVSGAIGAGAGAAAASSTRSTERPSSEPPSASQNPGAIDGDGDAKPGDSTVADEDSGDRSSPDPSRDERSTRPYPASPTPGYGAHQPDGEAGLNTDPVRDTAESDPYVKGGDVVEGELYGPGTASRSREDDGWSPAVSDDHESATYFRPSDGRYVTGEEFDTDEDERPQRYDESRPYRHEGEDV